MGSRGEEQLSYSTQGYRGSSQPNEPSIPRVRLVDSICVLLTQLVDNLGYAVVVVVVEAIADGVLESEGSVVINGVTHEFHLPSLPRLSLPWSIGVWDGSFGRYQALDEILDFDRHVGEGWRGGCMVDRRGWRDGCT